MKPMIDCQCSKVSNQNCCLASESTQYNVFHPYDVINVNFWAILHGCTSKGILKTIFISRLIILLYLLILISVVGMHVQFLTEDLDGW